VTCDGKGSKLDDPKMDTKRKLTTDKNDMVATAAR
jgi:hypothetical protein